eukprot:scaffold30137_cov62-Attheya_sp.AAC.1
MSAPYLSIAKDMRMLNVTEFDNASTRSSGVISESFFLLKRQEGQVMQTEKQGRAGKSQTTIISFSGLHQRAISLYGPTSSCLAPNLSIRCHIQLDPVPFIQLV